MQESAVEELTPGKWRRLTGLPAARIARLKDALARRPFLKNVSIMLTGSAGGQMVSILLSPVLTRLYSPQQFGILSVYSAALAILVVIASLRYELALPLTRGEEDAINLTAVCGLVVVATTACMGLVLFALPLPWLQSLWPVPTEQGALYRALVVLGYFCLGGYFIALYVATRAKAFRDIAKTRLAQGVVGPLSQIGLALAGGGAPGLVLGSILGQSAGTFGLFFRVIGDRRRFVAALSWQRMRDMAGRFRRFPLVSSWAALIDAIGGSQILYLLVSLHYSARIAGFLFLVERVVARPLSIVGTSILQVFVGEAGETVASDPAGLRRRYYQVISRQFALAALWVVAANIGGALLFPIVFGAEWDEAVAYLQAMSLAYLAQAVVLPVFHTLQILEKQALAAVWQIGRLGLTVFAFLAAGWMGASPPLVITAYSAAQALACLLLLVLIARSIGKLQKETP